MDNNNLKKGDIVIFINHPDISKVLIGALGEYLDTYNRKSRNKEIKLLSVIEDKDDHPGYILNPRPEFYKKYVPMSCPEYLKKEINH